MIVQANLLDSDGFIIEPVVVSIYDVLQVNVIKKAVREGLCKPKWDYKSLQWVEGATDEYVNEINARQQIAQGVLTKEYIDNKIINNEFSTLSTSELFFFKIELGLNSDTEILSYCKEVKIQYFKNKCESVIEEGFLSSNGNFYRTNRDDQTNMIGQKDVLTDETVQVPWKTENKGYVMHTKNEWLAVYGEAFTHKQTQLFKYDSLKNKALDTTTQDELQLINW